MCQIQKQDARRGHRRLKNLDQPRPGLILRVLRFQ